MVDEPPQNGEPTPHYAIRYNDKNGSTAHKIPNYLNVDLGLFMSRCRDGVGEPIIREQLPARELF